MIADPDSANEIIAHPGRIVDGLLKTDAAMLSGDMDAIGYGAGMFAFGEFGGEFGAVDSTAADLMGLEEPLALLPESVPEIAPLADSVAARVKLRVGTRRTIQSAAPQTNTGDFIDPNTGEILPRGGASGRHPAWDYGHKPGHEWWRTQKTAREQGWTRQQVIEYENDPSHYQIEAKGPNRSHKFESHDE